MSGKKIELLSPAKDLTVGMAAIQNGADAVYIGAPAFGARKAAANSLEDIAALTAYAHRYYCRVFITLNTILYDHELAEAEKLIRQLYAIGVDALIFQDMGILRMDLPPIALHASTQTHNYDLERIKFLDRLGVQRIVLARELSLEQIRTIRREVKAELEVFIHGALCVSLSGQCYLSQYMFGRSANRGECAQPCRMRWSVRDSEGQVLLQDKYVLSLKDLNLSSHIGQLIGAGVDSLKIEGRLKDKDYVANVTHHYSSLMNHIEGVRRVGSGKVMAAFDADPERSFNRGCSDYFLVERQPGLVNMATPKSMGKPIGRVTDITGKTIILDTREVLANGDGLCYLHQDELLGVRVNRVEGNRIECNEPVKARPGTLFYRNYDHRFVSRLGKSDSVRKIGIVIRATSDDGHLSLQVTDEDGVTASYCTEERYELARQEFQTDRLKQQLMKCGDSEFECERIEVVGQEVLFIPAAVANAARRALLENLQLARQQQRKVLAAGKLNGQAAVPAFVDRHYNVVNRMASEFYRAHGAEKIEEGFEKSGDTDGLVLMHTRYCILYELGRCRKKHPASAISFPLFIYNDKHCFRLEFDCTRCFMKIVKC